MIKVFVGNNWFGIKSALDLEINKFLKTGDSLNIERFYGPDSEPNDINAAIDSVSLFSDNKLVIVDQLSAHKEIQENIDDFLQKVGDETTLIIIEPNIDKRTAYYKNLKKLDGFKEFNELDENSLTNWVVEYAKDNSGEISRADAQYLIFRVGNSQTNIEREMTKLIQYDKKITKDTIDLLTNQTPSSTIFSLVDSAFSGDVKKALRLYEEQRSLRVEPQAIFGMLVWQMHIVAVCLVAGDKNPAELSAETGINSYVLGKSRTIAKTMGKAKILEFLDLLQHIEKTSRKQTYNFDDAMKLAITKLAY
jgi:DNA polymerase III delta subunit